MASKVENPDDYETDAVPQPPRDELNNESESKNKTEEVQTNCDSKVRNDSTKKIPKNKEFPKSKKNSGFVTVNTINISHSNGIHVGEKKIINVVNMKDGNIGKKKEHIVETKEIQSLMDSKERLESKHILFVSSNMGENWRDVARFLNYTDGQIYQFYENYRHIGIKEVIYQFLLDWKQNEPEKSTQGQLARILWKCNEKNVVKLWSQEKFD